ncbi:exonuclease SbcCD subunit D [Marinicrinis sediminis]|uniref:Nuclease SbcCD subunit D n=1 Tax=Marinicrinis sediminis TaxID=1652465 RepID=A0ABW5RBS1_9BACL
MRILHTADWHLGKTLEGRSRLEEQAAFLDELVLLIKDEQIDLILMAGDVYDTVNPSAAAEQLFYDAIVRMTQDGNVPIVAIAGNHDNPDRLTAAHPLSQRYGIHLSGLPSIQPVELEVGAYGERAVIIPFAYPSESRLKTLLAREADEAQLQQAYADHVGMLMQQASRSFQPQAVNVIMSHLFVLGGQETQSVERPIQVGGAYTVSPRAFEVGAHYTALGHLHRPQTMKSETPIRYSGSPLAYSFSEAGQAKSVTIVEAVAGKPVQVSERVLSAGKPLVKWHAPEGLPQVYTWLLEGRDAEAWIDLSVHVTEALHMEEIHQLRKSHAGLIHIRPIFPEMVASSREQQRTGLPLPELFRQFYRQQTGGAEAEDALVDLFLELIDEENEGEER